MITFKCYKAIKDLEEKTIEIKHVAPKLWRYKNCIITYEIEDPESTSFDFIETETFTFTEGYTRATSNGLYDYMLNILTCDYENDITYYAKNIKEYIDNLL